ncbi:MAG: methyltransferase domain-containing protein [Betaproteobacteria bacterium]|nr:methyltransferase domain-containing protein [Betaproteobacteria bacterium]
MNETHIHVGAHPLIEALQIYTQQAADEFQRMWRHGIDYLRFERASLPDVTEKTLAADLILRSTDDKHVMAILGILIKEDGIYFPSCLKNWESDNLAFITGIIIEQMSKSDKDAVHQLHPQPVMPPSEVTAERMVPGLSAYIASVLHIKRYRFLLDLIIPGKVLECASGTGYGAAMLSRLDNVTEYHGVDLSDTAVTYAKSCTWNDKLNFHAIDLAEFAPSLFENVISFETMEHVPNPYRFMELLIDRMSPDGQLLLSMPTETYHGSHLKPYNLANWNYKRQMNFLEQYFEDITVFSQKLSLLGPTTFAASGIFDSLSDDEVNDEVFVFILRRPHKRKRPNIVMKRAYALGDVIWTTPVLRELRRIYPRHNLVVSTGMTNVFLHNPDADLVFNTQYEPLPDDVLIDLDWAYETRRELHVLHAYAKASGISLTSTQPALYPANSDFRPVATLVLRHFRHLKVESLIAVHMGYNSPGRIWPREHWQRFLADLLQQNVGIVILGSEKDFSAADIGIADHRILCLAHYQLPLLQTAAALSLCDLLVAPDSGVLHIAAAVGVPCLGMFSMAAPSARMPFATGSRALWADIECRGCLKSIAPKAFPLCPREHADCMERILPEEVLSMTLKMLEALMPGRWQTRCRMALPMEALPTPLEDGIEAFNKTNFEAAIECLSTAMADEPQNPLPCAYLAFVCARQGLIQEARDFIAQTIRLAPERADLVAALGELLLGEGNHSEAAYHLREAVSIQPDLFAAYPALAQSLRLTGQSEEAISILKIAAAIPSDSQATIQAALRQIMAECDLPPEGA